MTVQVAQDDQFTFTSGLNSEAGFFTFPKNTWKDGDNLIPTISGTLRKRTCIDLETDWVKSAQDISATDINLWAFTTHKWLAVAGDGDLNFIVAQAGRYVWFYLDTSVATSVSKKSFTIDLNTYKASGNPSTIGTAAIKATSANGKLLITSRDTNPVLVTYSSAGDTISVSEITIQIRDFEGVDDGLAVDNRPGSLSTTHNYNLLNQGWLAAKTSAYFTSVAVYPSNAQSWIYGKDATDTFDATVLDKQDFGTSPAPKGRYILNAFYKDRTTASGVSITTVSENYRPSVCAFFAGRAWYAGVQSTTYGSTVFFSQVALDSGKYGKCYQDADPTSEVISDLIDSDGGLVAIQDCGQIVEMISNDTGIVVLATNGVWQIVGTSSTGFTAAGYEVNKISSFGCVGRQTVVNIEDGVLFWSYSGICKLGLNQLGAYSVANLTDLNIKTLYGNIPPLAKQYASSSYNSSDKTVYWLYNSLLTANTTVMPYKKTNILALDVRLQAFYTMSFDTGSNHPIIADVIVTKETLDTDISYNVVSSTGDNVVNSAVDQVVADINVGTAASKQYKFLTIYPETTTYELTFSDFLTTNNAPSKFYDWYSYDSLGIAYDCFIETGYAFAHNGPSKKKQAMYITVYMERTETAFDASFNPVNESSCTLITKWDFTDSTNANKWSTGQEVYRHNRMFIPSTTAFDDGYPLVITKNKIRGRGRAIQLRFTANPLYDMRIAGWSQTLVGGTNV